MIRIVPHTLLMGMLVSFFSFACQNNEVKETDVVKIAIQKGEGKKAKTIKFITHPDSLKNIVHLLNSAERNPRQFSTNSRIILYYKEGKKAKTILYSGAWIKYNKKSYRLKSSLSEMLGENE